jgi:hypothetical protein
MANKDNKPTRSLTLRDEAIKYYKLDAVISVGYRVNSAQATQFRIWAIAKNYLSEIDIKKLERAVSAFFDYIEGIVERRNTFTMASFAASVDKFLAFHEYQILEGYGSTMRQKAELKAFAEYDKFNTWQRLESDFDREVKKLLQNKGKNE